MSCELVVSKQQQIRSGTPKCTGMLKPPSSEARLELELGIFARGTPLHLPSISALEIAKSASAMQLHLMSDDIHVQISAISRSHTDASGRDPPSRIRLPVNINVNATEQTDWARLYFPADLPKNPLPVHLIFPVSVHTASCIRLLPHFSMTLLTEMCLITDRPQGRGGPGYGSDAKLL